VWRERRNEGDKKMHITRRFTAVGQDPYAAVPFRTTASEIRNPDGTPVVYQQSTFSPDTTFRWMPSIAMDKVGKVEDPVE